MARNPPLYDQGRATKVQLIGPGFGVSLESMSLEQILWLIPVASFFLAAFLMRRTAPFQRTAGDQTVKEAAAAEERARQFLAASELGSGLEETAASSEIGESRRTPRKRKKSVACGVIDRGPVATLLASRNSYPSGPGRYVAGVRGGVLRPRRLVFLDPVKLTSGDGGGRGIAHDFFPGLARAARRMRIPTV
jgi:hypothetical protein